MQEERLMRWHLWVSTSSKVAPRKGVEQVFLAGGAGLGAIVVSTRLSICPSRPRRCCCCRQPAAIDSLGARVSNS